jgi:hypothetical protein
MPAPPSLVEGEVRVDPPFSVSGWCRLPGQPRARAEIEILVDSRPVFAMVAREVRPGLGDGMHGFSLTLPVALRGPATCVVEARERESGITFGRAVLFEGAIAQPIEDRLSALDHSQLLHALTGPGPDAAVVLRGHFAALGEQLLDPTGDAAISRQRAALARRVAGLPLSTRPAVSVIVPASDSIATTLGLLTALHGLAEATPIEVILADDGTEPRTALLPQAGRGLRYARDPAGLTGHVLNQLVLEARAPAICFVDQAADSFPWAWPEPGTLENQVHLGGWLARGAATPQGARRHGPHGFALYLARATITEAGGFEPTLPAIEAYADMALKCDLLGAHVTRWVS